MLLMLVMTVVVAAGEWRCPAIGARWIYCVLCCCLRLGFVWLLQSVCEQVSVDVLYLEMGVTDALYLQSVFLSTDSWGESHLDFPYWMTLVVGGSETAHWIDWCLCCHLEVVVLFSCEVVSYGNSYE